MTAAVAHRGPDGDGIARLNTPGGRPTSLGQRGLVLSTLVARFDSTPGVYNANRAGILAAGLLVLDRFLSLPGEIRIALIGDSELHQRRIVARVPAARTVG